MTKFEKPGRRENFDYPDMAKEAVEKALKDANVKYSDIQQEQLINKNKIDCITIVHPKKSI